MRKIDWDKELSEEDVAFLRQMGVQGMEERIATHQAKFDAEVPDEEVPEDTGTKSALDPQARLGELVDTPGAPQLIDPTKQGETEEDDLEYDKWTRKELDDEVDARNDMEGYGPVNITGTGAGDNVTKADIVKGLRLWDAEYPDALK
jgi:hypothetical protein